jgi:hypothetical protein
MKQVIQYVIFLVFMVYWLLTIIYVSPNNYIRIQCAGTNSFMEKAFHQNWNFFAPPADFDQRLHISFYDKDSSMLTSVEVLGDVLKEKTSNAPFNLKEQYTDYSISGTLNVLNDVFVEFLKSNNRDSLQADKGVVNIDKIKVFDKFLAETRSPIYKLLTSLLRCYYNTYKSKNLVQFGKITVTQKQLPTFDNRKQLLKDNYGEEKIAYQSSFIKL